MNRILCTVLAAGVMALVGCESKSPPGGPGAVKPDGTTPRVGTPDNSFQIKLAGADLKQGESRTVPVSIVRGKNFDQDVKLAVANSPQGVTLKFDDSTLRASEKETNLVIQAGADAALGEHMVKVTATPARDGPGTSTDIKIEIRKP